MDPQAQFIASIIVGYAMQWGRAFQKIPDPIVYLLAALAGGFIYWAASPADVFAHGPKDFIWKAILFLFTIRGVAGIAGDAKAAPKSNTL